MRGGLFTLHFHERSDLPLYIILVLDNPRVRGVKRIQVVLLNHTYGIAITRGREHSIVIAKRTSTIVNKKQVPTNTVVAVTTLARKKTVITKNNDN